MDMSYFQKIQGSYGVNNKREKELIKINSQMSKHFEDTIDTEEVFINDIPAKLMIIKDTDGNTFKKKIKSKHNDKFNLGDYVVWNNQHWMITLIDPDEKTWNRGYMYLCSILLRWQDSDGKIIERWCYSEDFTKYSSGVQGNNTIVLGDNQYGLTIPVDADTKKLKRDRRFPIDFDDAIVPDIYAITNKKGLLNDNQSFGRGGLIKLTLSYDAFNKDHDKLVTLETGEQVWIADYISPTAPPVPDPSPDKNIILSIEGRKGLKLGRAETYTATAADPDGNEIVGFDIKWDIVSDFADEIIQAVDGNAITLKIEDEDYVDSLFLLKATSIKESNIVSELEITVAGLYS